MCESVLKFTCILKSIRKYRNIAQTIITLFIFAEVAIVEVNVKWATGLDHKTSELSVSVRLSVCLTLPCCAKIRMTVNSF